MANIETLAADTRYFAEVAAPATPSSGQAVIYVKSDGKIYLKDDAGTETDLTASGSSAVGNLWAMAKSSSQTLTNNTETAITFDRADIDGGSSVIDLANERFVAPATGFYLANVVWIWETTDPAADAYIAVMVGGSYGAPLIRLPSGGGNGHHGMVPLSLTSGAFVTLVIQPGAVTGVTARGNASVHLSTQFTLVRVT